MRLVIFVAADWFFLSHFLPRALAAKALGYDVTVVCTDTGRGGEIIESGLHLVSLRMKRHGLGLRELLNTLRQVAAQYWKFKPDIIWQIGLRPIVIGSLAARLAGARGIVNAPVGLGFVFASESWKARFARPFLRLSLKYLLNPVGSKVIFENSDDLRELVETGAVRMGDALLIRGAGVNLERYSVGSESAATPIVLFAARLIFEKGVGLFVEAARLLRGRGVCARFLIAGPIDHDSSSSVPKAMLEEWTAEGVVEWIGARDDMPEVLAECSVFCLPTYYREGLPKVLLEAMACGKPCITTDAPGCREAVRDGDNGLLIPVRDPLALANAIERLISDPTLRHQMGLRARERAIAEFSEEQVVSRTIDVFEKVRSENGGD